MSEMGDSSTENNEFQFYLLLVRQYIFQLPKEDERVRAAAWMVHLRRLRDAKDLKLRDDYMKLLLFAMHSQCLIGPFAQPPQKDKGLEYFPKNFTFADMMRQLIEESNVQSMRYCQTKDEDQLPFTPGECRLKVKVQENSEDSTLLKQTQTYRHNSEENIRATECKDNFVAETTASWVSGLTLVGSTFSPDLKVENLNKPQDKNTKECQSIVVDAAVKKEEGMVSAADTYQEQQIMQDTGVSLHHLRKQIRIGSNSSTHGENGNRNQKVCNTELHENNQLLRNSAQFTDALQTGVQDKISNAHYVDENIINNEAYNPLKFSDHSRYQHCHHHHHHKPSLCHSNDQENSALEMEVTGRNYIGQMCPQIPMNGGMTTHAKQDSSVNYGYPCFNTDVREAKRKQESSTYWLKQNAYNNLETNPLILNFQTDYDRHNTNHCNNKVRENCTCSHTMSTITENVNSCPLEFNNRKCNAECRSSAEIKERVTHSDEVMQKNNLKQSYITTNSGNGVNTTKSTGRRKVVTCNSGSSHARNMKQCRREDDPKTTTEEQVFPVSELQLPLHATNELSINEVNIKQRKSARDMLLQEPSKQIIHTQTETQENMSVNQRHQQSTEDIASDMIPKAKNSEFNVATFRASLSADLGAYSAGYAAGYSAGYAAGIAAALHSPPEHPCSVLH